MAGSQSTTFDNTSRRAWAALYAHRLTPYVEPDLASVVRREARRQRVSASDWIHAVLAERVRRKSPRRR